ncbi:hypothetical protein EHS25_007112 [Saitozyma podzolica]|uniref:Uncharacterized protein n=1 Tax=Saitozyma podzolica TaxID=1890683 RepID=A0A427XPL5_9TREE|nr:hypothetical protein EHS25_007112 [Saitozyma podzolica]
MTVAKRPPFKEVEASRPDFDDNYKLHYTKAPQPDFKPGGGLNNLECAKEFEASNAKWRSIKPEEQDKPSLYKLMISAIVRFTGLDARGATDWIRPRDQSPSCRR